VSDSDPAGETHADDGSFSFFSFTATRPVAISMAVLAAVVFGLVGWSRLPVDLLPDISYPSLTVRTLYPGASPEDVEERISERVQEAVGVVPGVRKVFSISRPEVSDVLLEFGWGTSMISATSDVRERLDRVLLPDEAEQPLVLRYDPSLDPVLTFGVSSERTDIDLATLRVFAEEEVEKRLATVPGVAAVKVRGGEEEEIRIVLDEQALTVLSIDVQTIATRLGSENVNNPSGSIDEGDTEFLVRTLGEFRNLDEVEDLIVARREGASVRLRDVAQVVRVPQEREVISRIDGKQAVLVDVFKEAGANLVELAGRVRDAVSGTAAQQAYVTKVTADPKLDPTSPLYEEPEVEKKKESGSGAGGPPSSPRWGPPRIGTTGPRGKALATHQAMTDYLGFRLAREGIDIRVLQDQSTFIRTAIDEVVDSALQGGAFAIVIIWLFLRRLRPTVILAVSIPISLVASFAPMYLGEVSLNVMSLGGLALGVGMLVDSSIVVLESITREHEDRGGKNIGRAATVGVGKVASAVTASTLTTVAVFFPIVFVEGVAGQLFRDQALTVVFSLLMALLVALFVIPMLASRGGDDENAHRPVRPQRSLLGRTTQRVTGITLRVVLGAFAVIGKAVGYVVWPIQKSFDAGWHVLDRAYPRILRGALRAKLAIVAAAIALLAFTVTRIDDLGSELIPEVAQRELYVDVFLPRDATVERTDEVVAPLEHAIRRLDDVERTFVAVGVDKDELNDSEEGEHSARILVTFSASPDGEDLGAIEERVREQVRAMMRQTPEVESYRFARPSLLSFSAPLVVEVLGDDLLDLRRTASRVRDAVAAVPGLRDVRSTLQRGNPELVIRLDRDKMAALGIDSEMVARVLGDKVLGNVPTRFAEAGRKIDMRIALARDELATLARLQEVNVNPTGSPAIPLGSVAVIERREGPSEIRRLGNSRGAEVQAAVTGFDIGSAQDDVADAIARIPRPPGVDVRLGGQKDEMARSLESLQLALLLAVFLVYIVMASQFESIVQPLIILATLPLAFVGAVLLLDVLGIPLSVIALLGGIVLAGIVVNNAIILIDQINRLRREGLDRVRAVVEGAHSRLRPVMMTTLTTVLGLLPLTGWLQGLPLLGGSGEGLELRAPLAIVVIAGLVSSTALTLVVIPVVYALTDRDRPADQDANAPTPDDAAPTGAPA
jgi:HAE1 family hydrophobic/amphiphilic exporter-1